MTKTACVLTRLSETGQNVIYGPIPEDGDHLYMVNPMVMLMKETYEELGEPSEITITIEPGDMLQENREKEAPLRRAEEGYVDPWR